MGIKLIVSEIDGVITGGSHPEDEMGNVFYKTYQSKDFDAINELKKKYTFIFLSKDKRVNYNMCQRRNIKFQSARNEEEKYKILMDLLRKHNCSPDEVIYIGSKISDRKCLRLIPKSFCPDDAGQYVKDLCWAHFTTSGGTGILVELLYLLETNALSEE